MQNDQIVGAPDWLDTNRFDINAKAPDDIRPEQIGPMMQALARHRQCSEEFCSCSIAIAKESTNSAEASSSGSMRMNAGAAANNSSHMCCRVGSYGGRGANRRLESSPTILQRCYLKIS